MTRPTLTRLLAALFLLTTAGCFSITTRPTVDDVTVQEFLKGEDCALTLFGLGWGTADIAVAQHHITHYKASQYPDSTPRPTTITKIRHMELTDSGFLIGVSRCVVVVGEP